MSKITKMLFWTLFLILFFASCGEASKKTKPVGSEGGACYGNKTCNGDLVCLSDLCVDLGELNDQDTENTGNTGNTTDDTDTENTGNTTDDTDTGNTGNTSNDKDTGNTGNSGNTGNTGDSGDSGDSGDTGNTVYSGVVCSGQTKCYNDTTEITCPTEGQAYYGQDGQYLSKCIDRNYTVSGTTGADIVTDNNTGLIWQRSLSTSTYNIWQQAITYCAGLNYAGQTDWRLPTRKELTTLPDYGKSNPAIDASIFPDTQSKVSYYWTSSSNLHNTDYVWYVYFGYGSTAYNSKVGNGYARCVRGSALPASSFTESTVNGKVIVTDTVTGIIWQKEYSDTLTWVNALNYCENLTYAGYTDWRLPNIEELETLIDDLYDPASSFPGISSNTFWASSSSVYDTGNAWFVAFDLGNVNNYKKTENFYARCVR